MILTFEHMTLEQRRSRFPGGPPYSIVRRTRGGVKYFQVSDMRFGGRSYDAATKREANRLCDQIAADFSAAHKELEVSV